MLFGCLESVKIHWQSLQVTTKCLLIEQKEYLANGDLRTYLKNHPQVSEETRKKIILGIARGMWHLHTEHVVHRGIPLNGKSTQLEDLAARNVLLTSTLEPKIRFESFRIHLFQ